ncbi:MAG: hypothetical protein OFPI_33240 [Osedax symbiont Rs2]|nr:MAG: hypothetical protein OFPI_33240 [Osedax symbiont Rs2]
MRPLQSLQWSLWIGLACLISKLILACACSINSQSVCQGTACLVN